MVFVLHGMRHVAAASIGRDHAKSVQELLTEFFGYFYVIAILGFLMPLALAGRVGRDLLLLLFLVVALGDSAAYFVGSKFGRRLLAPRLSCLKRRWRERWRPC